MYATVEQLKSYLHIELDTDDSLLEALLTRATRAIDRYTDRTFEGWSMTKFYGPDALDRDGRTLWLGEDLLTVDAVINGDGVATAIPSTEFWLLPRNETPHDRIRLKEGTTYSWVWDTDGWVVVEGLWGYSATPPEDIVHATLRWAAYMYRQRDAQVFDTTAIPGAGVITVPQGIPADVRLILDRYRRLV